MLGDVLGDDGYVVVDLLSQAEVEQLIQGWATILESYTPVWDVTGMAVTLRHPGIDHLAHDVIRPVVEPRIQELFADAVGFMSTYLVKQAKSLSLPPHLDWRLVEEPTSLTYGCWIPLDNMSPDSGSIGVIPGSHRLVDFDRTPLAPGHDRVDGIIARSAAPDTLLVEAGQAVIFDHRLIHFSDANELDDVRLAVNLGLSNAADERTAHDRLIRYMEQGLDGVLVASQLDPA